MKKSYITIVMMLCIITMVAQNTDYEPFVNNNSVWSISNLKYKISGDTTINEKNYFKVYSQKVD